MPALQWRARDYYFDRQYQRAKGLIPAHEIHAVDPCRIVFMGVYSALGKDGWRRMHIERLFLVPDAELPVELERKIGRHMRQVRSCSSYIY